MIRSKSLVVIFVFIFCASYQAFATVDYLAVNKITKEIYLFDQEQMRGIFWVTIGGGAEAHYLALGFTYTKNPYALDNLLTLIITGIAGLALFLLWKRRLIKRRILIVLFCLHLIFALKYLALYSYRDAFGFFASVIMFVIPGVILLIDRMIENVRIRRYSSLLHMVFVGIFGYLLFLQLWMPN